MFHRTIVLLLASAAVALTLNLQLDNVDDIDQRIFEDVINETIEGLRPDLPDPLTIDDVPIDLPNDGTFDGNAEISNFELDGLQGFELTALSLSLIGFELNFTLVLPDIKLYTDYDINMTIYDTVPFYGQGNLTINLADLEVQASTNINLTAGVSLSNLVLGITLDKNNTVFDIQGLYNSDRISKMVSDILNIVFADAIDTYEEFITEVLSPVVENLINSIIASLLTPTDPPNTESTLATDPALFHIQN